MFVQSLLFAVEADFHRDPALLKALLKNLKVENFFDDECSRSGEKD